MDPSRFAEKLRAVERQFAPIEDASPAGYAAQLAAFRKLQPDREEVCGTRDEMGAWLFIVLCRRYGIQPHRHARQKQTTLTIEAPKDFVSRVLWPQFQAMYVVFAEARTEAVGEVSKAWLGEKASTLLFVEEVKRT